MRRGFVLWPDDGEAGARGASAVAPPPMLTPVPALLKARRVAAAVGVVIAEEVAPAPTSPLWREPRRLSSLLCATFCVTKTSMSLSVGSFAPFLVVVVVVVRAVPSGVLSASSPSLAAALDETSAASPFTTRGAAYAADCDCDPLLLLPPAPPLGLVGRAKV